MPRTDNVLGAPTRPSQRHCPNLVGSFFLEGKKIEPAATAQGTTRTEIQVSGAVYKLTPHLNIRRDAPQIFGTCIGCSLERFLDAR